MHEVILPAMPHQTGPIWRFVRPSALRSPAISRNLALTKHRCRCLRSTTMKFSTFFALVAAIIFVDPVFGQDSAKPITKTAVLAGGCFWCIQPAFDKADGVIKTVVGYCGGTEPNPTYELVGSEKTQYRESIEITYIPQKFPSHSCSTFTGGKSIRPRPMANLPTSVRAIAPRFLLQTTTSGRSLKLQRQSWRAPASSPRRS